MKINNEKVTILKDNIIEEETNRKLKNKNNLIFKIEKNILCPKINKSITAPSKVQSEPSMRSPEIDEEKIVQDLPYKIVNPQPVYGYPQVPGPIFIENSIDLLHKFNWDPFNSIENNFNIMFDPILHNSNSTLNLSNMKENDRKFYNQEERPSQDFKKQSKGFREIFKGTFPQIKIETHNCQTDSFNRINHNIFENSVSFDNSPYQIDSQILIHKNSPLSYEEFLSLNEELGSANINSKLCFRSNAKSPQSNIQASAKI